MTFYKAWKQGRTLYVQSGYDEEFIAEAKRIRGWWTPDHRAWRWENCSRARQEEVAILVARIYGRFEITAAPIGTTAAARRGGRAAATASRRAEAPRGFREVNLSRGAVKVTLNGVTMTLDSAAFERIKAWDACPLANAEAARYVKVHALRADWQERAALSRELFKRQVAATYPDTRGLGDLQREEETLLRKLGKSAHAAVKHARKGCARCKGE